MFILKAVLELAKNPLINNTGLEILNNVAPQIVTSQVYQSSDYQALKNKKIAFKIIDQNIYVGCIFSPTISFFNQEEAVELLINIDSNSLIKLVKKEANADELIKENLIRLEGDSQLLIHLFNLSAVIDTSFEHILDKLFGTGPAVIINHFGNAVSNVFTVTNNFFQASQESSNTQNNPVFNLLNNIHNPFTTNDPFVDQSKK